ncbi:MAG: type II CAAX endopeptidase family protein [Candidatus Manganitrophus sp.]|nr:type II CAAX endopeptidase family protein [Candidatus Manganitrophus sp.]MDC4227790.1 type II CAAX endopeptidase family protein [Candidatus Manganitrophus sp.]WDT70884.1 MAG: type II CAAX endopeptidase family protein [Candidatus Manganitrophus sp.]
MIQTVPDENAPEEIKEETKSAPVSTGEIALGISLPFLVIAASVFVDAVYVQNHPWRQGTIGFVSLILFNLILLVYALTVCKRRGIWPLFRPISPATVLSMIPFAILIAFGINLLVGTTHMAMEKILNQKFEMPDYSALATFGPNSLLSVIMIVIGFTAIPILEEIYFRGFLYNALKTRLPLLFAANLQAILFAAAHGAGFMIGILYFIAGMALAVVYEMRKELVSPILVHGAINAMALMPLLALALQNFHMPAATWEEAERPPAWLASAPPAWIDKKENAAAQRQYAIDTWGSQGSKAWKKEAVALQAVCVWFPEDREACAKAKSGVVAIYSTFLKDHRRAVIEADRLIAEFPKEEEAVAIALTRRGFAYLMLQDLEKSRESFEKVINEYSQYDQPLEEAAKGIEMLERIEGG